MIRRLGPAALPVLVSVALAACGSGRPVAAPATDSAAVTDAEKVLNIYNWSDYIAPEIVPDFEKEYGIKVNYDLFDSNAVLQTKLLTGKAGVFRKLDKSLLPNLKNVDPELARSMELPDPGMDHAVNYFWGTGGVGYNVGKIRAAMPDAPHPKNAHLFINYMLRPEVSARNSTALRFASSNAAAYPLIDPAVYNDRSICPATATRQRLVPDLPHSQAYMRALIRMWTRFKADR